jgi:hypothetical protein
MSLSTLALPDAPAAPPSLFRDGRSFWAATGIQWLNFVTGFLILRWLTTAEYGQDSAVFAFQCVFAL